MKIRVRDVTESPEEVEFEEPTSELNPTLRSGSVSDFRCTSPAKVRLMHYCAGRDLFFDGAIEAAFEGRCARCLEGYGFAISTEFQFLVAPAGESAGAEGDEEDVDVTVYDGEEVDLSPLVRERILLSLPTTPLCRDSCLGLCARCGANLNREKCGCPADEGDPRMAIFRTLRVDR